MEPGVAIVIFRLLHIQRIGLGLRFSKIRYHIQCLNLHVSTFLSQKFSCLWDSNVGYYRVQVQNVSYRCWGCSCNSQSIGLKWTKVDVEDVILYGWTSWTRWIRNSVRQVIFENPYFLNMLAVTLPFMTGKGISGWTPLLWNPETCLWLFVTLHNSGLNMSPPAAIFCSSGQTPQYLQQ